MQETTQGPTPETHGAGESEGAPPGAGGWVHHLVAAVLFAVALFFALQYLAANPALARVLGGLAGDYGLGDGPLDVAMLGWSAAALIIVSIVGWFLIETQEVYLPRLAAAALAFAAGLGLCGAAFEGLAMAGRFQRPWIFAAPGALILLLWPLTALATRRRPETGEGGEGGAIQQGTRRALARRAYGKSLMRPGRPGQQCFGAAAAALLAILTGLTFYHALLYPATSGEALSNHLEYARRVFLTGGIYEQIAARSGMGATANDPHLYAWAGAAIATAAQRWSDLPMRAIPPMAGLAATLLIYHGALRLTRHVNFALAAALLYRAIPLTLATDQLAGSGALVMMFVAAFLYCALLYIDTALRGYFVLATVLGALAVHIDYSMLLLGLPWAGMILAAHAGFPTPREEEQSEREREMARALRDSFSLSAWEEFEDRVPPWTYRAERPSLRATLRRPGFLLTAAFGLAIGSMGLARNAVATGNPVYPHLSRWFGGRGISRDVLESMRHEALANGDGVGAAGATALERASGAWVYWTEGSGSFWLQPFAGGLAAGMLILLIARAIAARRTREGRGGGSADATLRFGCVAGALACAVVGLHYTIWPARLAFLLPALPALAMLFPLAFPYWRLRGWSPLWAGLTLGIAVVPGLTSALVGFKGPNDLGRRRASPAWEVGLETFRNPLPTTGRALAQAHGEVTVLWNYINDTLGGRKVLTYETRAYVFDPSIELIHLDDWNIQQLYGRPAEEQIARLKEMEITTYLRTPDEAGRRVTGMLGPELWIELGLVARDRAAGEYVLYRMR